MKKTFFIYAAWLTFFFAIGIAQVFSQIYNPVSWSTEVRQIEDEQYELLIHAKIDKGWHLYSQELPSDDGPIATEFTFPEGSNYTLQGDVKEPEAITEYDPNFDMDLNYFKDQVTFTQIIVSTSNAPINLTAEVYFMVCDEEKCLPPEYVDLVFQVDVPEGSVEPAEPGSYNMPENQAQQAEGNANNADDLDRPQREDIHTSGGGAVVDSRPGNGSVTENNSSSSTSSTDGPIEPVKWEYFSKKISEKTYELHFKASIDEGWKLYSQFLASDDGPIATAFYFDSSKFERIGEVKESSNLKKKYDKVFEMELSFFNEEAEFIQTIRTKSDRARLEYEFMVCNDVMCLPPSFNEIVFDLKSGIGVNALDLETTDAAKFSGVVPSLPKVDLEEPLGDCGEERSSSSSLWLVFLLGFGGGLIALLTPCVFPMIPLTVSFFTKGDDDQGKASKGLGKAVLYGFFIFLIYAVLSIPFHFNTDPEVLNEVATSVWLNLIFFLVFVVFAISFFGYFEITLPSSLTTKTDSASQVGGVLGIFFMALTLALVSFSCTGPILGTVLGSALKNGPWPITAAMSGFGIALGLPFALFAAFPSVMNKMPKSGGWLNSVKVVIGFIELALAVKFLSNADLVEQWGFLKRETFFLIWTLIGIGLILYLLGLIKFPHDSPVKRFSPFRIGFTALILAFTIYIAPGILKNPPWNHNLLSGFPPPTFYGWYEKETFHADFTDFEQAVAEAQAIGKPLLIDFTGWACVNCRKMEESVWTVERIKEKLREEFVLVSLYVDDKIKLPEDQQGVFEYQMGDEVVKKKIKTIGNKWATFQTQVFNNNSQPYYVMLSPDGYLLGNPVGYTPDVDEYADFLDCGIDTYRKKAEVFANKP